MAWIYILLLTLLTLLFIRRNALFKSEGIPVYFFQLAFLIKLIAGVCFVFVYSTYYQNREEADVFKYFDDAFHIEKVKSESTTDYISILTGCGNTEELTTKYLLKSRFWDKSPSLPFLNDNRFIIRFHAILLPFSSGNIYLHLLFGIMVSFIGLILLFNFFKSKVTLDLKWVFFAVFITPSMVFWTSSILKENFLFLGMGMLFYAISLKNKSIKFALFSLTGLALIALSKIYVLFILIPTVLSWLWCHNKIDGKNLWRFSATFLLFIGIALNLTYFDASLNIAQILSFKQSEFICLASWTGAGSQVYIPKLTVELSSFFIAIPFALFNALFRPMPWDYSGILSVPAMVEVAALITLIVLAILFFKRPVGKARNFILLSLFFTFSLSLLIGWTTPVLGAIVRYRIAFLPFLFISLLSLVDFKKLTNFLPISKTK